MSRYFDEEDDEWYQSGGERHFRARHVPPRNPRRSDAFLAPDVHYSTSLHRTRSTGHAPAPNVTIYNTLDSDMNPRIRADGGRASPRGRPAGLDYAVGDEIEEQVRLQLSRDRRARSRSRGAHDHHIHLDLDVDGSPGRGGHWELEMANQRRRDAEDRLERERRDDIVRRQAELKFFHDQKDRDEAEARLKLENDRLKQDWELKLERETRKRDRRLRDADDDRKRIILEEEKRHHDQSHENKRLVAEAIRKEKEAEDERTRIVADARIRADEAEKKRKAGEQAAIDAWNKKREEDEKKAKQDRERIIEEAERKKAAEEKKTKEEKERLIFELELEKKKKEAKEKAEWEEFLRKQEEKKKKEEAEKKKVEEQFEAEMRGRLSKFGFAENQIQAMIKSDKQKDLQKGMSPANPLHIHQPTYVKIHKDHLDIETLVYYGIPWEYDRHDRDYFIIMREMEQHETDLLFEHTKRLRSRSTRLLIEDRGSRRDRKDYAWVRRHKSRSPHRRRQSPTRVVGIKEVFY